MSTPEWPHGYGRCHCGCGELTNIARQNRPEFQQVAGRPQRYRRGHYRPAGGRRITRDGYVQVRMPDHPRARPNGYVLEHILVAEKALGRPLPEGVVVHHVNEVKTDNRPQNLVICQDQGYHGVLHQRQRALDACGRAEWLRCVLCGEYDDPNNLYVRGPSGRHRHCHAEYMKAHKARSAA